MNAHVSADGRADSCEERCAANLHCIGYMTEDKARCQLLFDTDSNAADRIHGADTETRNYCWKKNAATTDDAYTYYRIEVSQNAGGSYWCIEELSFYDTDGERLTLDKSRGSAQSQWDARYAARKAFNEISDANEGHYCSQSGVPTGWLAYEFSFPVRLSKYAIEGLSGYENEWSPVSWTFEGSVDGTSWDVLDTQSDHDSWSDGEIKEFQLIGYTLVGNGWCRNSFGSRLGTNFDDSMNAHVSADGRADSCEERCDANSNCIGYMTEDKAKCQLLFDTDNNAADGIHGADTETRNYCWKKNVATTDMVVALGDSIAEWSNDKLSAYCSGKEVSNNAVGGSTAEQWALDSTAVPNPHNSDVLNNMSPTHILNSIDTKYRVTHVWISLGVNDYWEDCQVPTNLASNLQSIFNKVRSVKPNAKIIVTGYAQLSRDTGYCQNDLEIISEVNAALKTICESNGVTFVDNTWLLGGSISAYADSQYFYDFIHYNDEGYCRWFTDNAMQSALECGASTGECSDGVSWPQH